MMAYALIGFAVLHTLTLALKSRALWLSCIYVVVLVFGWPVLAMVGSRPCRRRFRLAPALSANEDRRRLPAS